jgi:hypothetical protein
MYEYTHGQAAERDGIECTTELAPNAGFKLPHKAGVCDGNLGDNKAHGRLLLEPP